MQVVIEKNNEIVGGPGQWRDLRKVVGLDGNALPPLPHETKNGTVREYRENRPEAGKTETHGDPVEGLNGEVWVRTFPLVPRSIEDMRAEAQMTRLDLAMAAAQRGWVTEAEAEDWAASTAIPGWVASAIDDHIPADDRLAVRIAVRTQQEIGRNDRLIPILAAAQGLTDAEVDELFGIV